MAARIIDIRKPDIDYLDGLRKRHEELVLEELLKDISSFITKRQLPVASAPEGAKVKVRLPLKKEYRFKFGFAPFGEKGQGVGQSSLPQEGDRQQEQGQGQGRGGEEEGEGREQEGEKQDKSGSGQKKEKSEDSQAGKRQQGSGQGRQDKPRLRRGQEIGRLDEESEQKGRPKFGLGKQKQEGKESEQEGKESEQEGGEKAGQGPGKDEFETEINIEDLRDKISEEFELPPLDEKSLNLLRVKAKSSPHGYRTKGPLFQISGDKTKEEYLKRKRADEEKESDEDTILPEDFRFRRREEEEQYLSNLAIYLCHDASGSMDERKLEIIRALAMHWVRAGRKTHKEVELEFITFHTQAARRSEGEFFYLQSSGGTTISSGSDKILELSREKYNPEQWNSMVIFFTDGENDSSDMRKMYESFRKVCQFSVFFAYYEVLASSTVISSKEIEALGEEMEHFVPVSIREKGQTAEAFLAVIEAIKESKRKRGADV